MPFWLLGKCVLLCSNNVYTFLKQEKDADLCSFFVTDYIAGFLISLVIP